VWVVREFVRLVLRIVLGFVLAFAFAVLWAAVGTGGFEDALRRTTLGVGCLALLLGGIGRGSNFERAMASTPTEQFWGRIPGTSALQARGEDRTLAPGAVFFLTGAALLALAIFVL
jgi:hypothetical protein